jgi:hypothetical protein
MKENAKHQTPNTKRLPATGCAEAWNLEFLWCLEFGVWCFGKERQSKEADA